MLTEAIVEELLLTGEQCRPHDGHGLYLQVSKPNVGSWLFRYGRGINQKTGKKKEFWMGLGSTATFSLKDARDRARIARQQLHDGLDPIGERVAVLDLVKTRVTRIPYWHYHKERLRATCPFCWPKNFRKAHFKRGAVNQDADWLGPATAFVHTEEFDNNYLTEYDLAGLLNVNIELVREMRRKSGSGRRNAGPAYNGHLKLYQIRSIKSWLRDGRAARRINKEDYLPPDGSVYVASLLRELAEHEVHSVEALINSMNLVGRRRNVQNHRRPT